MSKKYREIEYCGFDWYVIDEDNESYTLLLKEKLQPTVIKDLFKDKYLDTDFDVGFNLDDSNWRWKDSIIRQVLNQKFLDKYLDKNNLIKMKTTVFFDNEKSTAKDYARLLTKEELENLDYNIRKVGSKYGYWTMSPYYLFSPNASASVWSVNSLGKLYANCTTEARGVRPVIKLKADYKKQATLDLSSAIALKNLTETIIGFLSDIDSLIMKRKYAEANHSISKVRKMLKDFVKTLDL